jgi:hypothetical protein
MTASRHRLRQSLERDGCTADHGRIGLSKAGDTHCASLSAWATRE